MGKGSLLFRAREEFLAVEQSGILYSCHLRTLKVYSRKLFSFVPFSLSQVKFPVISTPVNAWKEFVLSTFLFLYTVCLHNVLSVLSFSVF